LEDNNSGFATRTSETLALGLGILRGFEQEINSTIVRRENNIVCFIDSKNLQMES